MIRELQPEPPKPQPKLYLFREYRAHVIFKYKGILIKELTALNDFYGELTCINLALEDARKYISKYKIEENSEATIEIELRIIEIKKKKTGRKQVFHKDQDEYENVGYSKPILEEVIWTSAKPLSNPADRAVALTRIEKEDTSANRG